MGFLLPLLVALIPLLITPGLLFHYDSLPKVALLVLIVALALMRPNRIARDVGALWDTKAGKYLCVLALAQVLWSTVATLTSSRPLFSLLGSNWRRFGLLTTLALAAFTVLAASQLARRPRSIVYVLRATAIAAIGISLYTAAQYFNIDPLQNGAAYHAQDGDFTIVRPPSTMGHADYLGWWLAIAVLCSWGLSRVEGTVWRRVALIAASLSTIAIVLSGTRSAVAAIGFGLLYLTITSPARVQRKHILWIAAAVAAFTVFYVSPGGEHLRARVRWTSDEVPGGARPLLWRDTLKMAAIHPLTGFGPETFAAEFPRYQSVDLARLVPDFYHESPHNVALDALTSEGIPGLLIAVGWLGLGGWLISQKKIKAPIDRALAAAFVASCVASFFNVMTIGPAVSMFTLLAILLARSVSGNTGLKPPDVSPTPKAITYAVSLPLAAVLAGFGVLLVFSDFKLQRFSRIAGGHDSVLAVDSYQSLRGISLAGPSEDLYCSRKLADICGSGSNVIARLQCSLTGTQAAVRATNTADNPPNAWYNLAMFTAAHNDGRGTEKALRTATELAPNWFRPHWALAKFLDLSGRKAEAATEIRRAALLGAGKEPDVTDSLRTIAEAR